jgi:hypothetical protein
LMPWSAPAGPSPPRRADHPHVGAAQSVPPKGNSPGQLRLGKEAAAPEARMPNFSFRTASSLGRPGGGSAPKKKEDAIML